MIFGITILEYANQDDVFGVLIIILRRVASVVEARNSLHRATAAFDVCGYSFSYVRIRLLMQPVDHEYLLFFVFLLYPANRRCHPHRKLINKLVVSVRRLTCTMVPKVGSKIVIGLG